MMRNVRTTVNIDDRLLGRAKSLAVKTGRPLGEVIDDGLRLLLAQADTGRKGNAAPLPTFGGGGLQPGVDLEDKDALGALLDADDGDSRAAG
jgi:hypothetical protein